MEDKIKNKENGVDNSGSEEDSSYEENEDSEANSDISLSEDELKKG